MRESDSAMGARARYEEPCLRAVRYDGRVITQISGDVGLGAFGYGSGPQAWSEMSGEGLGQFGYGSGPQAWSEMSGEGLGMFDSGSGQQAWSEMSGEGLGQFDSGSGPQAWSEMSSEPGLDLFGYGGTGQQAWSEMGSGSSGSPGLGAFSADGGTQPWDAGE